MREVRSAVLSTKKDLRLHTRSNTDLLAIQLVTYMQLFVIINHWWITSISNNRNISDDAPVELGTDGVSADPRGEKTSNELLGQC